MNNIPYTACKDAYDLPPYKMWSRCFISYRLRTESWRMFCVTAIFLLDMKGKKNYLMKVANTFLFF